jgi:hypothetical protein
MGLWGLRHAVAMAALCLVVVLRSRGTEGLRLWIDEGEECFSQGAKYEGDSFHVSFVVIQDNSPWHHSGPADGIDLVVCYIFSSSPLLHPFFFSFSFSFHCFDK